MKKNKWLLVLLVIMLVMQTFTVDAKSNKEIRRLKFDDIETLMKKRNSTIKINKNIEKNLIDSIDAIKDAEDSRKDLEYAIDEIDKAISGLNQKIRQQDKLINEIDELIEELIPKDEDDGLGGVPGFGDENNGIIELPDIEYEESVAYDTFIETIGYVQGIYESNISTLKQNRNALKEQLKQLDKLPAQELELEKAILQLDMANESIIYGAQNMYLGYNSLRRQKDELVENLELLEEQIDIMVSQEELGMITLLDIKGIENQKEQLELGIKTLDTQMDNIKKELNLMMDQDFDTPLKMEDTFIVDKKIISKIKYKSDLRVAKRNSYSLQLKNYDYKIQNINAEWAEKHGNYDEIRAAARNLENASIEFSQEHKNVELVFDKVYEEIQNKVEALEIENKNLEYQQDKYHVLELRYELGLISEIEFKQGEAEYNSQMNKVKTAEQNLFQAWLQYEALLQGINFQQ